MKRSLTALLLALAMLASTAQGQKQEPPLRPTTPTPVTDAELAAQTVVVFNENDLDSVALAGLYAETRGIPVTQLVGLKCSGKEEILRSEYDRTIAEPLRWIFVERKWWTLHDEPTGAGRVESTKIRFVVLIRGIPLKIIAADDYPGNDTSKLQGMPEQILSHNEAAVDSELAVLGLWTKVISGVTNNPYFKAEKNIDEVELESQLLVCRLDGPSSLVVRRMIEDSAAAEKEGLRGFVYVDTLGLKEGPMTLGDKWFNEAAQNARENGLPVVQDSGPALFPAAYPMSNCAMYLGWYNEHVSGPFTREGFRFAKGAVAYHLHSFSASTLRDPHKNWCAPLLAAGAVATMGNVYEPYLGLLPRPEVFEQRLREGFTFAEAAYMSQPYLSWMTTFVGDPLYRPFKNIGLAKAKAGDPWDAYRAGVDVWLKKGRVTGENALRDSAAKLKSGVVSEGLGLLELSGNAYGEAIKAFEAARAAYDQAADRVRVAVHEAGAIRASKGTASAIKFLRAQAEANRTASSAEVLQLLIADFTKAAEEEKTKKTEMEEEDEEKKPVEKKPVPKGR